MKVKYIRWSTVNQTGNRQSLDQENYDLVLREQVSGTILFSKRQKGSELLNLISKGKVNELHVEELSRLGRNAKDTLATLELCAQKNVNVHILNMSVCSLLADGKPNPVFKLLTHVMAVISEQEAECIKFRTENGKIAARSRGVVFGRRVGANETKAKFINKEKSKAILKYLPTHSVRDTAKLAQTSTTTVQKVKKVAAELNIL